MILKILSKFQAFSKISFSKKEKLLSAAKNGNIDVTSGVTANIFQQ